MEKVLYCFKPFDDDFDFICFSGENWKLNRKFSLSSMVQMGLTSLESTRTVSEDKEKSRGAAKGKMQLLMKDVYAELRRSKYFLIFKFRINFHIKE